MFILQVPDYYNIIKQPISFQKIKDKLNCLVYGSPQEVIDDVALVFRNAVEYNKVRCFKHLMWQLFVWSNFGVSFVGTWLVFFSVKSSINCIKV